MNKTYPHILRFPNAGLKAIFEHEIRGQLSDGAWENLSQSNHWEFWNNLKLEVNEANEWEFIRNPSNHTCPGKKTGYNLFTLVDPDMVDLSFRMRAYYVDAMFYLGLKQNAVYFVREDGAPVSIEALAKYTWLKDTLATINSRPDGLKNVQELLQTGMKMYTRDRLIVDLKELKVGMKLALKSFFPNNG